MIRHRPHAHHWAFGYLAAGLAVALILFLIVVFHDSAPKFTPTKQPIGTAVDITTKGIQTDMTDLQAADLSDTKLAQ